MAKRSSKAYANTSVSISKSREDISAILLRWGVKGIQWEDNFESGCSILRFRWKAANDKDIVARFRIELDSEEELRAKAIDKRNDKFSQKKYQRLLIERGKREHRLTLNLLKNMFEAIEEGIMPAEALLLPWIEDAEGQTVYDRLAPKLAEISGGSLMKALGQGDE